MQLENKEEKNQCDGCARNLPLKDGVHSGGGYDLIGCTKERYTPQTPEEEVDYSVKGFIQEYMNDRNMRTRWLRGIFYDEEEKIDTILLYMRKIEEKISQAEERGRADLKKSIREEVESKKQTMKDNHLCRFNDGEQNCDCYLEVVDEILSLKSLE